MCALRASRYGLKAHVFQRMVFLGVPCFILNCIWLLYNDVNCTDARDLDYVEFMSGEGNIFGSMLEMMLHACGYDNQPHPILQNLLRPLPNRVPLRHPIAAPARTRRWHQLGPCLRELGLDESQ